MNRVFKLLATAVFGLVLFSVARAQTPALTLLLINFDEGNPPFMSANQGKVVGVYPALISEAFARLKIPVQLEAKPWKRALLEMDQAKGGIGGVYKNDERAKKYDFSEPLLTENIVVYFNKSNPVIFKSIDDLGGKSIGVIGGWSYGSEFDTARKSAKFTVTESPSDSVNLRNLAIGRLDAVLAIEEAGDSIIAAAKLDQLERNKIYLASNNSYLAFNKSSFQIELLAKFNKVLAGMKKDGFYKKIVLKELSD